MMKALKSIGQVLAAVLYTNLYTGLLYLILVCPLAWLMSLDTKVMIILVLVAGGLLQALVFGAQMLINIPFAWIVKKNLVALIISIGFVLFNLTRSCVLVWKGMLNHGSSAIVVAIIITALVIEALWLTITWLIASYQNND